MPQAEQTAPLRSCVHEALRNYLRKMEGHDVTNLYRFVIDEIEQPLLDAVLEFTGGNQTRAARVLGLSRSTLRKKLRGDGARAASD